MASKNKTYELALKIAGKVDSSLGKACKQANDNLASIGSAAKKAGKIAATAMGAAATAAAGVAVSSLHTYEDFQQAMANTSAIAQANAEEYKALEAAAREMGAKTTKTATEAAEALGYMALAGWDTQQSIAGLEPVLRLSEATQMDLARCSDLVTDSMSALGIGVEDMTAYLDLAVQTNNKANTTAEMLMEAFIGCGGAAKTVGADMTELSTALGILANNGTKGAEAGTAMNAMLVRMTSKDTAIIVIRVPDHTTASVVRALDRLERKMGKDFRRVFKSITVDNGSEFMDCEGIERSYRLKQPRTKVYYCHPYSPQERGSNENMNRIIRRIFPKGTNFDEVTPAEVAAAEEWLNNYPREILGWKSSQALFDIYIAA